MTFQNICNTLYCCKSEGYISEPFQANLGVKQVDSLSPILFNIFVDDICSYFNNAFLTTLSKTFFKIHEINIKILSYIYSNT
jgi:hypothetical protein